MIRTCDLCSYAPTPTQIASTCGYCIVERRFLRKRHKSSWSLKSQFLLRRPEASKRPMVGDNSNRKSLNQIAWFIVGHRSHSSPEHQSKLSSIRRFFQASMGAKSSRTPSGQPLELAGESSDRKSSSTASSSEDTTDVLDRETPVKAKQKTSIRSLWSMANGRTQARVLSDRQKVMIQLTWKQAIAPGKLNAGVKIFQNIFRRCPDLKRLFHLEHIANLDELPKEERFVRHARVFGDVIDLAVRNLDDLDVQVAPALVTLGRRHFYKHNVGFRPEYMAVFAQAMMDFVIGQMQIEDDKEVVDGWWMLTVYLVSKLQHGYGLESMGKGAKMKPTWLQRL